MSIEEANLEWPEMVSSSPHDLSAWIEYYLPHETPPPSSAKGPSKFGDLASSPVLTGLECSLPIVQGIIISNEDNNLRARSSLPGSEFETSPVSQLDALIWITPTVWHFVADTSLPDAVPLMEAGIPSIIASATTEVLQTTNQRQDESEDLEATYPRQVRIRDSPGIGNQQGTRSPRTL